MRQVLVLSQVQHVRRRAVHVALDLVVDVLLHPLVQAGPLPDCVEEIPSRIQPSTGAVRQAHYYAFPVHP